jgi:hypothetical protein
LGEQEELVGQHQVLLLVAILAAGAAAATAAVHVAAARLGWGPIGSLGSQGEGVRSSGRGWLGLGGVCVSLARAGLVIDERKGPI